MRFLQQRGIAGLVAMCVSLSAAFAAEPAKSTPRHIMLDAAQAIRPVDRFFDLSVGSDFPGTLIDKLNALTKDLPEADRVINVGNKGSFDITLPMRSNDIVLVTLERRVD